MESRANIKILEEDLMNNDLEPILISGFELDETILRAIEGLPEYEKKQQQE